MTAGPCNGFGIATSSPCSLLVLGHRRAARVALHAHFHVGEGVLSQQLCSDRCRAELSSPTEPPSNGVLREPLLLQELPEAISVRRRETAQRFGLREELDKVPSHRVVVHLSAALHIGAALHRGVDEGLERRRLAFGNETDSRELVRQLAINLSQPASRIGIDRMPRDARMHEPFELHRAAFPILADKQQNREHPLSQTQSATALADPVVIEIAEVEDHQHDIEIFNRNSNQ